MSRGVALLLVALAATAGCGGSEGDGPAGGCREAGRPEPRAGEARRAPNDALAAGTYRLHFDTSCGSFTVTLDLESAPKASASLVALADDGYFDDTIFHRIVPGFVIQGGDPTQSGGGGPGYTTVDPPAQDARYVKGVVAMAKTPAEPPGAAGSQFFVVTGDDARLPPEYAIVGRVTGGLDVVERIGELGDAAEQPTQTVLVESVSVRRG